MINNPFVVKRRIAIIGDRAIDQCRACRHRLRVHEEGVPVKNLCEVMRVGQMYKELKNINVIPEECIFAVKKDA